jgi:hypothetical protein
MYLKYWSERGLSSITCGGSGDPSTGSIFWDLTYWDYTICTGTSPDVARLNVFWVVIPQALDVLVLKCTHYVVLICFNTPSLPLGVSHDDL